MADFGNPIASENHERLGKSLTIVPSILPETRTVPDEGIDNVILDIIHITHIYGSKPETTHDII